jgi:hypothetical protein
VLVQHASFPPQWSDVVQDVLVLLQEGNTKLN